MQTQACLYFPGVGPCLSSQVSLRPDTKQRLASQSPKGTLSRLQAI